MNTSDNQAFESYVPVYDAIPEKWEDGRAFIVEQLKRLANAVNFREIGFFIDEEVLSGKAFIPGLNIVSDGGSSQQFRTVLRKVIDFGTLPNAGAKSVPHRIVADANFTLVAMWAAATDPTGLKIPIPFATPVALNQNIALQMDATNVTITTGVDRTNFTRTFVVIEFMQEL